MLPEKELLVLERYLQDSSKAAVGLTKPHNLHAADGAWQPQLSTPMPL